MFDLQKKAETVQADTTKILIALGLFVWFLIVNFMALFMIVEE